MRSELMTQSEMNLTRRSFLKSAMMAGGAVLLAKPVFGADSDEPSLPKLKGNRLITFNTVVRVNQIEVSRDRNAGEDEGNLHTLESVRRLRDCFEWGFPGGRITWAFSWLALQDQRPRRTIDVRSVSGIAFEFMRISLPLGLVLVFLVPRLVERLRLWLKRPEGNDFVFRCPEVIETGGSAGQRLVGGVCIQTPSFQDRRLR